MQGVGNAVRNAQEFIPDSIFRCSEKGHSSLLLGQYEFRMEDHTLAFFVTCDYFCGRRAIFILPKKSLFCSQLGYKPGGKKTNMFAFLLLRFSSGESKGALWYHDMPSTRLFDFRTAI